MINFDELYRQHASDVYRFALYLSGNRHDAEDITSETFARAFVAAGAIRMATVKGTFSRSRHLFLKTLRRRHRHVALDEQLADTVRSASARLEAEDDLAGALASMQSLPEVDRAALLMRGDDVSYEEIARALGLTLASVKVKIHRARVALQAARRVTS